MLPPHYKKIGFATAATAIIAIVALEYFFNLRESTKIPIQITIIVVIIGLFIPMISREKQEDEMIRHVRRTAFIRAFIAGIFYYITLSITNMIFDFDHPLEAGGIIFWQLCMYHVYYYYLKKDIEKDKPELF